METRHTLPWEALKTNKTLLGVAEVENSFAVLLNTRDIIMYKQTLYFNDHQYVTTEILWVVMIADF